MKKFLYLILFVCLFGGNNVSFGQNRQFYNLTMADGLSHPQGNTIAQDKYGFIWVGTYYGLNLFDGNSITKFYSDPDDENTLPGNDISTLYFQGDTLWIGTRAGLCIMNITTRKITRLNTGDYTNIRVFYKEKKSPFLWIGTDNGLLKYNTYNFSWIVFTTSNSNISHNIVRAIYQDTDRNLWVGTFDRLNKLPANSTVFQNYDTKQDYRPSIKNNLILSLMPYSKKNDSLLWLGTQTGLVLFNRFSGKMKFFREENSALTNSVIKTILTTKAGITWIGTDFGLAEMNRNFDIQIHLHNPFQSNSLANSIVWDIFEDNSGNLWFATNNGISILPQTSNRFQFYPMTFYHENNLVGYEIRDIMERDDNSLWMATQNGVVSYNTKTNEKQIFTSMQKTGRKLVLNNSLVVFEDSSGRIWMGTNGGLTIWYPSEKRMETFSANFNSNNGLRSNYINDILELEDHTILVNTWAGLHHLVENNGNFRFEFIRNFNVSSLCLLKNDLWAIHGNSLLKIDTKSFKSSAVFNAAIDDKEVQIYSLLISNDSIIWMGLNNGLIKYNIETGKHRFFEIKGNKQYRIINLLSDNYNNIWATSFSAVIKFSPQTQSFEIFPGGEEIPINRFEEGCALKTKNGDLIFGGHDGFIRFSPDDIAKSEFLPPTMITRLSVLNQTIVPDKKYGNKIILKESVPFVQNVDLSYSQRSFSLEFSALTYGNRNGIRYAYKLEGIDPDWNYINDQKGVASYSDLPSGRFVFRVKGTNTDGIWNEKETALTINILPPFWATPLFIAIYIVLLISIAGSIVFYYSNRIKMKNELKFVKLEKEHAENIAKARQQFFTNISHELRTPLSLIIGPVEKLLQNSSLDKSARTFVHLIEKNARRLLWLNNQLLDFRQLENRSLKLRVSEFDIVEFTHNIFNLFTDKAERKKIDYSFHSGIEKLNVWMDLHKIETILFNLLSNAFKFTQVKGEIRVTIQWCTITDESTENHFCIKVKDSGIGISEEDQKKIFTRFYQAGDAVKMERGSGIGLTLVDGYVKMHQGRITVKSELGKGSEFIVEFPSGSAFQTKDTMVTEKDGLKPLLTNEEEQTAALAGNPNYTDSGMPLLLLVEDDNEIVDFIRLSFRGKYNFSVAENGKEALRLLETQLPQLVICDVVMPVMDGIEFTRKFKSNARMAHIPLILLTGQAEKEKQLDGLRSGADAYIIKPFEIELLEVRIENFLKRKQQLTEFLKVDNLINPKEIQIASQDEKMLEKVVICIENHISDTSLDVNKVCSETGFSHAHLYRKIKNLSGMTVNEFIRTVRLRRAEQLLKTKKFTVAEVMDQTGFSNHSYFSKCFRKMYKMTPKEYSDK